MNPVLVILSSQQLPTAAKLLDLGQLLYDLNTPMAFGGLIFNRLPTLQDYIPGYFLGERLEQAVKWVANRFDVLGFYRLQKATKQASKIYKQALAHFTERQGLIETEVWHTFRSSEITPLSNYMTYANKNLARNIIAALTLGDLHFLDPASIWVEEMLGHYRLSADLIPHYLQVYHQAAKNSLDERGQLLVEYLAQMSLEKS